MTRGSLLPFLKKKSVGTPFLLVVILAGGPALAACAFDTDCTPGARCLKPQGSIYGMCVGGVPPENGSAKSPTNDPLDLNKSTGNACTFDIDCGVNSICAKANDAIAGACMPKHK
jgi:hypothetical protein